MMVRVLVVLAAVSGVVGQSVTPAMATPSGRSVAFHGSYSGFLDTNSAATFRYKNYSGTATLLGKSTFTATAKYGERFGEGSGCFLEEGIGKLSGKNGSALQFAYAFRGCEASVSTVPIAGSFLVYNGTKKLAGAQGGGKYTVYPNGGSITFDGTLLVR